MSRVIGTPYIEWAKARKGAWNLAVSGLPHATLDDIGGLTADMPLTGDNAYGYAPLLERIASRHGVATSQVVTTTGCSMACFLALAALIEPADEVIIERPTYEPLVRAALHLGASVRRFDRLPVNAFRIDVDEVIGALSRHTRAIVLTSLHNPSSQLVPGADLRRIGAAALAVGARVLVDEVYLDAVFDDTPATCVHLGPTFVATNSLTKVYGLAALRCGWVIADEALSARIWRVNDLYENSRPFAADWLAARAFDHLDSLRARSQTLLTRNRQVLAQWLAGREDVECVLPTWGTTICLRPTRVAAANLCDELQARYDVSIVPGYFFELPDHVRIALCTSTAVLREGLARIGHCLDDLRDADRGR